MYTLEQAILIARELWAILGPAGYHCGLTGSVLYKGESKKDIDFVIYPHSGGDHFDYDDLRKLIRKSGFVFKPSKSDDGYGEREVWIIERNGIRIDLIFPTTPPIY